MGERLGYARVATLAQDAGLQADALRGAGCFRVVTDRTSETCETGRAGELFGRVRPGDTVVVRRPVGVRSLTPGHCPMIDGQVILAGAIAVGRDLGHPLSDDLGSYGAVCLDPPTSTPRRYFGCPWGAWCGTSPNRRCSGPRSSDTPDTPFW